MTTVKFCKNTKCGGPLAGKQRLYCSAKCKMAVQRQSNGNQTVTETNGNEVISDSNSDTANVFSLFSHDMLPVTRFGIGQMKSSLLQQAKLADVYLGRLTQMTWDFHIQEKIEAQQVVSKILYRMVDDLLAIEVTK